MNENHLTNVLKYIKLTKRIEQLYAQRRAWFVIAICSILLNVWLIVG